MPFTSAEIEAGVTAVFSVIATLWAIEAIFEIGR